MARTRRTNGMSQQRCPKNKRNKARFDELSDLNWKMIILQSKISASTTQSVSTILIHLKEIQEEMSQLQRSFNTFQYNITTDWFQFDRQEQLQQQQRQEQVQQQTQDKVQQQPQEQVEEPIMDEKHFILMSQEDNGEVKYEVCTESSTSEYTSQYTSEYTEEEET